jgi:hypothetical protein
MPAVCLARDMLAAVYKFRIAQHRTGCILLIGVGNIVPSLSVCVCVCAGVQLLSCGVVPVGTVCWGKDCTHYTGCV